MYYLDRGLSELKRPKLGKILGISYAALAIWSLIQWGSVQQTYAAISDVAGLDQNGAVWPWIVAFSSLVTAQPGGIHLGVSRCRAL